jgi:hypothetical protein
MRSVTGGSYPARIFTAYMKGALKDLPVQKFAGLPTGEPNGANPTDSPSASAVPTIAPVDPAAPVVTVMVPDVRRAKVADATAVLQGLGLSVVLELQPGADSTRQLYVLDQFPASTTAANSGSVVTLKVVNVLP